jgi:hypothetical protein
MEKKQVSLLRGNPSQTNGPGTHQTDSKSEMSNQSQTDYLSTNQSHFGARAIGGERKQRLTREANQKSYLKRKNNIS